MKIKLLENRRLISRIKELIALVQNNEKANDLTAKLLTTEEEIIAKEKYERDLAKWKEEGFRRNEIALGKLVTAYNNNEYGGQRLILNIDEHHMGGSLSAPSYRMVIRISISASMQPILQEMRDIYDHISDLPTNSGLKYKQLVREELCTNMLGLIAVHGLIHFIALVSPTPIQPATTSVDDPYFNYRLGVNPHRPTNSFNLQRS